MPKPTHIALVILATLLLAACQGIDLDEANPINVDLSGDWRLEGALSDPTPDFKSGLKGQRRKRNPTMRDDISGALGSALAFIVHDFQVLSAERVEIEQSHDSLGIRYDPGVYRDVSWGERQRGLWEVYAGWDEAVMVIISKAEGMRVEERFRLNRGQLIVDIIITADGEERTVTRVFTRA